MKNIFKFFVIFICVLSLFGCPSPVNTPNTPNIENEEPAKEEQEEVKPDNSKRRMEIYEKVMGKSFLIYEGEIDENYDFLTIEFGKDYIKLDNEKFNFNPSEDVIIEDEGKEYPTGYENEWGFRAGYSFIFTHNGAHYTVHIGSLSTGVVVIYYNDYGFCYLLVEGSGSEGGSSGEDLSFSITGTWKYNNTSLSINEDGTFSFSNGITATKTGEYEINGNQITLHFENGVVNCTDTFTVSGSEEEITLNLVKSIGITNGQEIENTHSLILQTFYNIAGTTITLSK